MSSVIYVSLALGLQSLSQCKELLEEGDANRATACTRLNAHSSRSHAALLVHLTRRERQGGHQSNNNQGTCLFMHASSDTTVLTDLFPYIHHPDDAMSTMVESTLYLVDLAGSERAKQSGGVNNHQRFQELKAINLSLSALGNCISALSQTRPHVPFRDSKLTRYVPVNIRKAPMSLPQVSPCVLSLRPLPSVSCNRV